MTDHHAAAPARTPRGGAGAGESDDRFQALQPIEPDDKQARAARKRAQIQRAAIAQFLQHGYAGTSIDDITAAARVSKQTVYKHFGGKEGLFLAIINDTVGEVLDEFFDRMDLRFNDSADLERELCAIARRFLSLLMRPELLALRRLVIGEASRFPQLGDVWWRGDPGPAPAAPGRPGRTRHRRPGPGRPAVQLARAVDPGQPGHVPSHPAVHPGRAGSSRRDGRAHIPGRLPPPIMT